MEYEKLKTYFQACADCEVLSIFSALDLNNIIYVHENEFKRKHVGFGLNKYKNTLCIYDIDLTEYKETLKQEIPLKNVTTLVVYPKKMFINYIEFKTEMICKNNVEIYD